MSEPTIEAQVEEYIDNLASAMYTQRAQSPREMTPERWAGIKERFPGTVRSCVEDVKRFHGDDIRSFRAYLLSRSAGAQQPQSPEEGS